MGWFRRRTTLTLDAPPTAPCQTADETAREAGYRDAAYRAASTRGKAARRPHRSRQGRPRQGGWRRRPRRIPHPPSRRLSRCDQDLTGSQTPDWNVFATGSSSSPLPAG